MTADVQIRQIEAAEYLKLGTPVKTPSSPDSFLRTVTAPLAGFNMGMHEVINLPFTLANISARKFGFGVKDPFGIPTPFEAAARKFEPQTSAERIGFQAGRIAGQSVPIAGAVAGFARGVNLAAQPAAGAGILQGLKEEILRNAAMKPKRFAAAEVSLAGLSGFGEQTATELFPETPLAPVVGAVAAPFAPAAVTRLPGAQLTREAVKRGKELLPKAQEAIGQKMAAEEIKIAFTPEAEQNIMAATKLQKAIPELDLTLAERSRMTSLVRTQAELEKGLSGSALDAEVKRRLQNEKAIKTFAEDSAPGIEEPIETVFDETRKNITFLESKIDRQRDILIEKEANLAALLPKADRIETGKVLKERLEDIRTKASEAFTKRAKQYRIDDLNISAPFESRATVLVNKFKRRKKAEGPTPQVILDIEEDIEAAKRAAVLLGTRKELSSAQRKKLEESLFTLADVKKLRERVTNDFIDEVSGTAPSRTKIRDLSIIKGDVDNIFEQLADDIADPDLANNYTKFREEYFEGFISRFEEGAAFKVRQRNTRGFDQTLDERVASAFIGTPTEARQFKQAFGDDPEAMQALYASILDDARAASVREGAIKDNLLKAYVRKSQSVLKEFPSIKSELDDIVSAKSAITARHKQLDNRAKSIQDKALVAGLRSIAKGTRTSEAFLNSVIANPVQMRQLTGRLRQNEDAFKGLQRNVWTRATSGSAADMETFLNANRKSLALIFSKEHLKNLDIILEARQAIQTVPDPTGMAQFGETIDQILRQELGTSPSALSGRFLAVRRGRTNIKTETVDAFAKFLNARSLKKARALMEEALYNEQVAKDLAEIIQSGAKIPAGPNRRLNTWLFLQGTDEIDVRSDVERKQIEEFSKLGQTIGQL